MPLRAALLAGLLALAAAAAPRAGEPADGIRAVITAQLEAFQRDDFAHAFTFASPMIQGIFGTPENFGRMVRNGYPMVWRPAEVEMGGLNSFGGRLYQDVILRDGSGRYYVAEYEMIEVEGAWRINGVRIREAQGTGA
jgi:hypothetical protein